MKINNLIIAMISFTIYTYRMSRIENCLFRKDSENVVKFRPMTLLSGIIAPFKLMKLSINHLNKRDILKTFRDTFLTFDNIFFNIIVLKTCHVCYNKFKFLI